MIIYGFTTGIRRWPLLHFERTWPDGTHHLQRIPGWAMKGREHRCGDDDFEVPICIWAVDVSAPLDRNSKWIRSTPRTCRPNTQLDRSLWQIADLAGVVASACRASASPRSLSAGGVHELEIAILQGHASPSVARDYITKHPESLRKAIAVMDRLRERLEATPEHRPDRRQRQREWSKQSADVCKGLLQETPFGETDR